MGLNLAEFVNHACGLFIIYTYTYVYLVRKEEGASRAQNVLFT